MRFYCPKTCHLNALTCFSFNDLIFCRLYHIWLIFLWFYCLKTQKTFSALSPVWYQSLSEASVMERVSLFIPDGCFDSHTPTNTHTHCQGEGPAVKAPLKWNTEASLHKNRIFETNLLKNQKSRRRLRVMDFNWSSFVKQCYYKNDGFLQPGFCGKMFTFFTCISRFLFWGFESKSWAPEGPSVRKEGHLGAFVWTPSLPCFLSCWDWGLIYMFLGQIYIIAMSR